MKTYKNTKNNSNRMGSGLILLVIGLIFFLRNFGIGIPGWIFSWHMLLIVIGLLIGYKRDFNGSGWLIMVLIGGYFTVARISGFDFSQYYFAVAFIGLGLFLILKPKRNLETWEKKTADFGLGEGTDTTYKNSDEHDFIDSVNVFSGSKQQVFSKAFKGGDVISIFGGCDLNLTQADIEGTVSLDVIAIFGGVKIIVPPTWAVKSEVTAIFGGLDDKRSVLPMTGEPDKVLKITGLALFGGVDIRNY
jgi:predicted membrane protein